jgi:hypothetical protein
MKKILAWLGKALHCHRYERIHRPGASGGVCVKCGATYWMEYPRRVSSDGK